MRRFFIIVFHSLRDIIGRGFFKLSTLIMSLLIIGALILPDILYKTPLNGENRGEYLIYIVDNSKYIFDDDIPINLFARDFGDYIKGDYYFEYADKGLNVSEKLKNNEIDGYIEVNSKRDIDIVSHKDMSELIFILDRFILSSNGYDISYPSYNVTKPDYGINGFFDLAMVYLYPMMLMMIVYSIFIMHGQFIAFSVKLEKDSKITDILLTKVKPHMIILGRVFGLLIAGLIQIIYFVLLIFLTVYFLKEDSFPIIKEIISFDLIFVVKYILYFLLGFILYGLLFNVVGSIVHKIEDLSMWIIPIIFVMSIGYFCAIINLQFPDNYLKYIVRFIPFLSSFVSVTESRMGLADVWSYIIILISIFILIYVNIVLIKKQIIFKNRDRCEIK